MTINVGMLRSTKCRRQASPRNLLGAATGQRHELPIRRTRVRELSQFWVGGGLLLHERFLVLLRSCLLAFGGQAKAQGRHGGFSPDPLSLAIHSSSIPWLAFTCFRPTTHSCHFSASGAAAGSQGAATHAVTAANATHHEGITTRYSRPLVTTLPLWVHVLYLSSPPLLSYG